MKFLSTLPARGATLHSVLTGSPNRHFYPRSPRGERPGCPALPPRRGSHFYPRSPRGERRKWPWIIGPAIPFLSTLPARGATP